MGKKAKLKKQRHQKQLNQPLNQNDSAQANPQDFIRQMSKEGYRLEQIKRSPEVPRNNIEPRI